MRQVCKVRRAPGLLARRERQERLVLLGPLERPEPPALALLALLDRRELQAQQVLVEHPVQREPLARQALGRPVRRVHKAAKVRQEQADFLALQDLEPLAQRDLLAPKVQRDRKARQGLAR